MAKSKKRKSNIRHVVTKATAKSAPSDSWHTTSRLIYVVLACLVLILLIGLLAWFIIKPKMLVDDNKPQGDDTQNIQQTEPMPVAAIKDGSAYWCRRLPAFIAQTSLQQPLVIDTSQTVKPGVVLRELRGQKREYRHPSWQLSGHVSSAVMDKQANLYVVPVPTISLDTNPVAKRNAVYRIDAQTGVMTEFMQTNTAIGSSKHPYGNIGVTFDCDHEFLYVSNVAESGPYQQAGRIYQIDPVSQRVLTQLENTDAIGLGVFNYQKQKRLYFGSARDSALYSIGLGQRGEFLSDQRYELSLFDLPEGDTTSIKKIVFNQEHDGRHIMTLSETKFGFRLVGETAYQVKKYQFVLDLKTQRWRYVGAHWE